MFLYSATGRVGVIVAHTRREIRLRVMGKFVATFHSSYASGEGAPLLCVFPWLRYRVCGIVVWTSMLLYARELVNHWLFSMYCEGPREFGGCIIRR